MIKLKLVRLIFGKISYIKDLGLFSKRVNDIKKIFCTILEDAIRDEIIVSNPVSKSRPLPVHQEK
ncbi:hypothetical protein [Aliarcobacter butzleri]|uniref:hypothetical protein n=1 Tax=Aliarcobacter butzleri TaxID=28197 RepID=UPI00344C42D0